MLKFDCIVKKLFQSAYLKEAFGPIQLFLSNRNKIPSQNLSSAKRARERLLCHVLVQVRINA